MSSAPLPHFDKPVSRFVIGSMSFSTKELERTFATLDEYIRLGGNTIDMAHVYGPEHHKAVGAYLRERGRESLILFDKGCHPYGRNRVTREDMESDIRENHERLGVEHTDFFVLHRDDPAVPVGDILQWLNEFKAAGLISAFGGSNWHHSRIQEANDYAQAHGIQGFSASSPNLALATPIEPMWGGAYSVDREARGWYEQTGFPLFSWSSGANGFFAGVESDDVRRVYHNDQNFGRKARAEELAKKHGCSTTQIAVAWTLNQPANVFAIVGPRTPEEVRESLAVLEIKLTPDELRYLEDGE
jgi:aryl-alcohol dehydrogenase-like predicted oxidoreductase